MADFKVHTKDSAPDPKPLEMAEEAFGFAPNLIGVLAEAPVAAKAYLQLGQLLGESSFDPVEQQVVLLTVSFENGCEYCMGAHSAVAKMNEADDAVIEALREGKALPDERLEALHRFTRAVVRERGWVGDDDLQSFLDAGFEKAQVLEVLVGVAMKTLSNYTNHIAETPLDEQFEDFRWENEAAQAAAAAD